MQTKQKHLHLYEKEMVRTSQLQRRAHRHLESQIKKYANKPITTLHVSDITLFDGLKSQPIYPTRKGGRSKQKEMACNSTSNNNKTGEIDESLKTSRKKKQQATQVPTRNKTERSMTQREHIRVLLLTNHKFLFASRDVYCSRGGNCNEMNYNNYIQ